MLSFLSDLISRTPPEKLIQRLVHTAYDELMVIKYIFPADLGAFPRIFDEKRGGILGKRQTDTDASGKLRLPGVTFQLFHIS